MNDEEVEDKNDLPADNGEGTAERQQSNESVQKSSNKKSKLDTARNILKKAAGKHSLLAAIGPILFWIFVGIVILIIIIGLAMFLITMPGMVMEQIKALFEKLGNYIAAFYGADTTQQISDTDIYETLDYLEQMGYDLKGFGFLTDYVGDNKSGVEKDDDDKISNAKSDYIFTYIASDNYVYTLKNDNLATQESADNWFEKLGTAIATRWYRIKNFFFGPVFDFLGVTNAVGEKWGKGLIGLYYENGNQIGKEGTFVNQNTIWNWDNIKINLDNKTLSIARNTVFNNNNAIEFSLDGWTGRYGMPIEFLLSIHLATMMPDLAVDMVQYFPTEIKVFLHEISGEARTAFKSGEKYITYEEVENAFSGVSGRNPLSAAIAWFDGWIISDEEANKAFELGLPHNPEECSCDSANVSLSYAGFPVSKDADGKYFYVDISTGALYEISEENVVETPIICGNCKDYIKRILRLLRKDNDYNFKAYMPYIASVNNHWYRDVHFVMEDTNLKFIDYDYEYEAVMKERWTLYETYTNNPNDGYKYNPDKEGEYILYPIDENGKMSSDPFSGTTQEAENKGIKLSKKAITIDGSDEKIMKDLGWQKPDDIWLAYEENKDSSATDFEEAYPNISEDTADYEIKKKIYIQVDTMGNIVQTGEGQREQTNQDIKKIFLQNKYFRYDGSPETAEIITELRKKVAENHGNNVYYSSLTKEDLKESIIKNEDGVEKKYTVEDVAANVSLNQDSLNAFSMLENTHTLDADYIYRDFKELMVELGYFTKEELTDETPRLLQWLVPDIGSGGYPNRTIDKREQEYGTMVHSKADIEANNKNTIRAIIEQMEEEEQIEGNAPETANVSGISNTNNSKKLSQVNGVSQNLNANSDNILSSNNSNINLRNVKGAGASFTLERVDESGDGYVSVLQSGNVKYIHRYQGGQSYSGINFFWAGGSRTLGQAACGLFACFNVLTGYGYEFDPHKELPGYQWPATMDAVKNLMEEKGVTGEFIDYTDTAALDEALNEGRPAILLFQSTTDRQGVQWTSGGHFVALVGKDKEGNIVTVDSAAQGNVKRHDYPGTTEDMLPAFQTNPIWIADEPPTGMKQSEGEPYVGYEGNEAVVSPVTGILLEYGTYTDEDKEGSEEYRTNVDLKYGPTNIPMIDEEGNPIPVKDKNPEEQEGGEIVADKVGYAKILVLDSEHYKKLEANTNSRWKNESESLIRINSNTKTNDDELSAETKKSIARYLERLKTEEQMDEEHEKWSEIDKLIYGYKEFAEIYEKSGIAGNIVYIDGFVCEEPDENLAGQTEPSGGNEPDEGSNIAEQLPEGDKLTLDSFKIKESELEAQKDNEDALQNKYERDDEYKLASKVSTDKLNAESSVKEQAGTAINITAKNEKTNKSEDLIYIKEGTVIGRTMTDKELVEKIRKDPPHDYEYYRPEGNSSTSQEPSKSGNNKEENEDKVMGNYIRIIMRDLDDTVVENVEDYMKLDDGGETSMEELDDEKFLYWMGIYIEGGVLKQQGNKWISTPKDLSDGAGATHYFGLTHYNLDLAKKLGYNISNWGDNQDLEMLTDVYLALIEEQKAQIKQELGENIEDGYLQAFISILHNYGNLTKRGREYKASGKVSESTWTTYEGDQYKEALTKRRIGEWILITEGKYMNSYEGNTQEIDFTDGGKYSEETPFTDWCKEHGITNIEVTKPDE